MIQNFRSDIPSMNKSGSFYFYYSLPIPTSVPYLQHQLKNVLVVKSCYVSNPLVFSHHQITDFSITYRCVEQGEECCKAIREVAK